MTDATTTSTALSYADALHAVLTGVVALEREIIPLEAALGRALAAPVLSPIALPPWDNAGMDGYAVRRADVIGATAEHRISLSVIGSVAAGADPTTLPVVTSGTATRIMTGAPVPSGADAVIRIEDTDRGMARVSILSDRDLAGRGNVRPRGEDVAEGAIVFSNGTTIGASHLGTMASVGCAAPVVHRRPRVTVLASGDELVMLDRFDEVLAGRRIVSSTSYALPALLRHAGADVRVLPLLADDLAAVTDAVRAAVLDGCDLLVTTGGVSVGAHDYTRDALAALGSALGFWRASIRPGGPIGTGRVLGVPWLGLPGNPVSTMVTGALFAWPLIRVLGGHATFHHAPLRVRMCDAVDTPAPLTYFVRVRLTVGADGTVEAHLAGPQGSNLLRTMALANALLVVPESVARVEADMMLSALLLPGAELLSETTAHFDDTDRSDGERA
jgi:molybdopterin molybdotransferase